MADEAPKKPIDPETLLVIKAGLAQAVLNYLLRCPCGEVFEMVGALLNLQPLVQKEVDVPEAVARAVREKSSE
jgi:hypothetical protein